MTKREVDVIGGLNMTDQISNEAYKQIMIVAEDEYAVLDEIRAEIVNKAESGQWSDAVKYGMLKAILIIDKYREEKGE